MNRKQEIADLRARGFSDAAIRDAVGYKTLSGVRGMASKAKQAAKILQDDLYYPSARDINDNDEWVDYLRFAKKRDRMLKILFHTRANGDMCAAFGADEFTQAAIASEQRERRTA